MSIKILFMLLVSTYSYAQTTPLAVSDFAIGSFMDDYKITYTINDSLWVQHPNIRYHIIKWNPEKQYLIAKNDALNKADANKYTRIDYMTFEGMEPFLWGFCLTAYKADTDEQAEATAEADRQNPKKGCNGFPFSRMKRVEINSKKDN